ncbi:MAG: prepilin-type N-terminal cleavage/methylation domain-containing protein [Candidatus Riflebacteria bacterium]|nr:prepilin-type N-terminal cleavage/methylation domain-containing protein [Candidatus Riflebacteria bacterium]
MNLFKKTIKYSGMTLIEVMVVTVILVILLLPMSHFLILYQESFAKGYERLNTLTTARLILEQVSRDVKIHCFRNNQRFSNPQPGVYEFLIFPGAEYLHLIGPLGDGKIPLNLVRYYFDANNKTLVRTVKYHPRLQPFVGQTEVNEIIGKDVDSFSIDVKSLYKINFFNIDVTCRSLNPSRKTEVTHLRTAVRSEFECRLWRNRYQVPNLKSEFLSP